MVADDAHATSLVRPLFIRTEVCSFANDEVRSLMTKEARDDCRDRNAQCPISELILRKAEAKV